MLGNQRVARALFRSFSRALRNAPSPILLFDPVNVQEWGRYDFVDGCTSLKLLKSCMGELWREEFEDAPVLTSERLVDPSALLTHVVAPTFQSNEATSDNLDTGFACLRELNRCLDSQHLARVATTDHVQVEVVTTSTQQEGAFCYRIRITNLHESAPVRVTGRHLFFHGDDGLQIEVPRHSPGVVGQRPVITPGMCFQYHSGAQLDSPAGFLEGVYHVEDMTGESFDVTIPVTLFLDKDKAHDTTLPNIDKKQSDE